MSGKVSSFFYAIDAGNAKQAEQIVSKLIKKTPDSVHYHLLENYYDLKVNHNLDSAFEKSLALVQDPNNFNQIANNEVLDLLLTIFKHSNHSDDVSKIFEVLLKKQPFNTSLIEFWFQYSLTHLNVSSLQKASFHSQKVSFKQSQAKSPQMRNKLLTAAFNYYLAAQKTDKPLEKKLFPQLGTKLLAFIEPLVSDQEIFVKVKLLSAAATTDTKNEIIKTLDDLLAKKKFNEIDLSLIHIYLESLRDLQIFEKLYNFTFDVVFNTKFDDFNFWNFLLLAAFKTNKQQTLLEKMQTEIVPAAPNAQIPSSSLANSRNLSLALINFAFLAQDKELLKAQVYEYYRLFGGKKCAFPDLKKYFSHPEFDQDWFLNDLLVNRFFNEFGFPERFDNPSKAVLSINEVTLLTNFQKFKFLQNKDKLLSDKQAAEAYVSENLLIFNHCYDHYLVKNKELLATDYYIGNELLLINLQISLTMDFSSKNVFQQLIILKHVLAYSPQDFNIKLWVIKLYNYLNLPQASLQVFKTLSVKNVQVDTLNHYLSHRFASRFPDKGYIDFLKHNLNFYNESSYQYLIHFLKNCYENNAFLKIEKYIEFLERIQSSYEKWYSFSELLDSSAYLNDSAKVTDGYKKQNFDYFNFIKLYNVDTETTKAKTDSSDRINSTQDVELPNESILTFNTAGSLDNIDEENPKSFNTINYSDNRDFATEWRVGINTRIDQLQDKLITGPITDLDYLKLKNLKNNLFLEPIKDTTKHLLDNFNLLFAKVEATTFDKFTPIEVLELKVMHHFWNFIVAKDGKEASTHLTQIQDLLNQVTVLFKLQFTDPKETIGVVNWEFAHIYILAIHIYKTLTKQVKQNKQHVPQLFSKYKSQIDSTITDSLAKLQREILQVHENSDLAKLETQNWKVLATWQKELAEQGHQNGQVLQILKVSEGVINSEFKAAKERYLSLFKVLSKI